MFAKSLALLLRRLPLVIGAAVLAIAGACGLFVVTPPTQQSQAAVLFVPSVKQPGVEGPTNPLLSLGSSVSIVASVVQIGVSDDETADRMLEAGHSAKYEVVADMGQNSGPVLLVTTEDKNPTQSQGTRDAVVAEIKARLQALQDERAVANDLRVSTVTLVSSTEPKLIHKSQIQSALMAGVGLLVALLLGIIAVEARSDRRHSPRARVPAARRRVPSTATTNVGDGERRPVAPHRRQMGNPANRDSNLTAEPHGPDEKAGLEGAFRAF